MVEEVAPLSFGRRKLVQRTAAERAAIVAETYVPGATVAAEFVAKAVQDWINAVGAKTAYIEPGSPWENGYCESFNARFRDECLNGASGRRSGERKVQLYNEVGIGNTRIIYY